MSISQEPYLRYHKIIYGQRRWRNSANKPLRAVNAKSHVVHLLSFFDNCNELTNNLFWEFNLLQNKVFITLCVKNFCVTNKITTTAAPVVDLGLGFFSRVSPKLRKIYTRNTSRGPLKRGPEASVSLASPQNHHRAAQGVSFLLHWWNHNHRHSVRWSSIRHICLAYFIVFAAQSRKYAWSGGQVLLVHTGLLFHDLKWCVVYFYELIVVAQKYGILMVDMGVGMVFPGRSQ